MRQWMKLGREMFLIAKEHLMRKCAIVRRSILILVWVVLACDNLGLLVEQRVIRAGCGFRASCCYFELNKPTSTATDSCLLEEDGVLVATRQEKEEQLNWHLSRLVCLYIRITKSISDSSCNLILAWFCLPSTADIPVDIGPLSRRYFGRICDWQIVSNEEHGF